MTMNHHYPYPEALKGVRFIGRLSDRSEIVLKVDIGGVQIIQERDARARAERTLSLKERELLERSTTTIFTIEVKTMGLA